MENRPPVPIIPGVSSTPPSGLPTYIRKRPAAPRRGRTWIVLAVTVGLAAAAGVLAFVFTTTGTSKQAVHLGSPVPSVTGLRKAEQQCSAGELSDGDRTLFLDMYGKKSRSGTLAPADIQCVLEALNTPTYVTREMEETRALDGRQTDTWGPYSASWSYHPDQGLDILIRQLG